MTEPKRYSEEEIAAELARWSGHKHFGGPIETIKWFADHTPALLAILTQLRRERDAARAEVEAARHGEAKVTDADMKKLVEAEGDWANLLNGHVFSHEYQLKQTLFLLDLIKRLAPSMYQQAVDNEEAGKYDDPPPAVGTDSKFAADEGEYIGNLGVED